jgi:hypothetical protein
MDISFKKHKHEGRYRSFEKDFSDIKLDKKVIGHIQEVNWNIYQIGFAKIKEKTNDDPAPFKWVWIKQKFNSEKEARMWVNANFEAVKEQINLYRFPKEDL